MAPHLEQGKLSAFFTLVGESAGVALQLSLFLHLGTTLAAAAYFWEDIKRALSDLLEWRPRRAFEGTHAEPLFVVVATLMTGLVVIPRYVLAVGLASDISGGVFVVAIGVLLILTGVLQLASDAVGLGEREEPSLLDAVIVGAAQGLSIVERIPFWAVCFGLGGLAIVGGGVVLVVA